MPTYIARISYGKDSLKMLDVIVSRGLPLDRITTSDVWATDTVSACLPPVEEFKARMDEVIWRKYRMEVEHLCARNKDGTKRTYEQMFYSVPRRKEGRKEVDLDTDSQLSVIGVKNLNGVSMLKIQGTIKSFPGTVSVPWCQKLKLIKDFRTSPGATGGDKNIVEYIGIAADEPKRFGQLNEKKRAPLVEFGIEEGLCGLYCQYGDMLSPSYETSCRDGCWFCHNQGLDQLRLLRKNYPDRWALLLKWDKDSVTTFRADGHTVHDLDYRFQCEDEGLVPKDKTFRWGMLDAVQLRMF